MKVLFISDYSSSMPGGAQMSNQHVIKEGRSLGYDITEYNHDSSKLLLLSNYDAVISSNLDYMSRMDNFKFIFDKIVEHPFHIRYEHDSCSYLHPELRRILFESTKLNLFLSDFHLYFFQEIYGDYFKNNEIVYDPINTEIFQPTEQEKEYDYLYCGYGHVLKGLENFINFAKTNTDKKFAFVGWFSNQPESSGLGQELLKVDNIKVLEKAEPSEVPNLLRKTEYIYHDPIVNEPFCRMVAEALLCGCKLKGARNKIGSYLEYQKYGEELFREKCKNAPKLFWEKINEKSISNIKHV